MQPLGKPVVPDVYWMFIRSSSLIDGGDASSGDWPSLRDSNPAYPSADLLTTKMRSDFNLADSEGRAAASVGRHSSWRISHSTSPSSTTYVISRAVYAMFIDTITAPRRARA